MREWMRSFLIGSCWIIGQQLAVCSPTDSMTHFFPLHLLFISQFYLLSIISLLFLFYSIFLVLSSSFSSSSAIPTKYRQMPPSITLISFLSPVPRPFFYFLNQSACPLLSPSLLIAFSFHFLFFCSLFSLLVFNRGTGRLLCHLLIVILNGTINSLPIFLYVFSFVLCDSLHSSPYCSLLYDCALQSSD